MPEQESNGLLTGKLLLFAAGMFAFGFLVLPPLYNVFCELTGFGGRTSLTADAAAEAPELERSVRVEFVSTVNGYKRWEFEPEQDSMEVHPGKMYFATFRAKNLNNADKTTQAVPSIAPGIANEYFRKIQCFCFESQEFAALEQRSLPVQFIVDPGLPDYVDTITLSYTLFEIENTYVTRAR